MEIGYFEDEYPKGGKLTLTPEVLIPRIGDVLVEQGKITADQLQQALEKQREFRVTGKNALLGQIIVEMGMIDQSTLDQSITQQILILQNSLRDANANLERKVQERTAELEIAYRKLSELNELKANFISNISHELRTPLTHINGYVDLVLTNPNEPLTPDQKTYVNVIKKAAGRLERLIDDLILFSTSETNRLTIIKDRFDPSLIVSEVYQRNIQSAEQKQIHLEEDIQVIEKLGFMDRNKITWVVNQLVENAIKYSNPGGRVIIRLIQKDDKFFFEVADTGIGIPEERQTEIFEPFHQLDGSSTRSQGGTGIGLSLVQKILDAHQSVIKVQSTPNIGSIFSFAISKK
jgi:signal transduction histidine kinase